MLSLQEFPFQCLIRVEVRGIGRDVSKHGAAAARSTQEHLTWSDETVMEHSTPEQSMVHAAHAVFREDLLCTIKHAVVGTVG